jgi:hypothetical protein
MLKYKSIASYAPCMNNVDILFSAHDAFGYFVLFVCKAWTVLYTNVSYYIWPVNFLFILKYI